MEIKSLQNTPIQTILDTLNLAFSDYMIPINFTMEYVNERWTASGVGYSLSFGVFDQNKLVGFIIHAINYYGKTKVAYNASTGIIPSYRRKGLLTKLYNSAVVELKKAGIEKSVLEVITGNERAILAYQKAGFTIDKHFKLYKFDWQQKEVTSDLKVVKNENINFDAYTILENYNPSIENQFHCLEKYKSNLSAVEVFDQQELVAYLITHKNSKRIHRLGVKNNDWNTYGELLFSALKNDTYNIINIDAKNVAIHSFFKKMKFENYIDQYEMSLQLI